MSKEHKTTLANDKDWQFAIKWAATVPTTGRCSLPSATVLAIDALLRANPRSIREPMTDEQIDSLRERLATHIAAQGVLVGDDSWDHDFARLIEAHHGIPTSQPEEER